MAKKVTFEAEVRGHEAPFHWKLYKKEEGVSGRSAVIFGGKAFEGSEDTKAAAVLAARRAAEEAFKKWCHQNTKDTVTVFTGTLPDQAPAAFAEGEIEVVEPERAEPEPVAQRPLNPAPELHPQDFMD